MPLTSNPQKLSVTTQCVVRTVAECRGACEMSDSRAASSRTSADSAMAIVAEDSTRMDPRQWGGKLDLFISPKCRNHRYPIGNLPAKGYSHPFVERYTLDL